MVSTRRRRLLSLSVLISITLAVFLLIRPATTASADVQAGELTLSFDDLAGWENEGGIATERALTLASEAPSALFTSPPIEAPLPFNAVVVSWGPRPAEEDESVLSLYVRTAPRGGEWGEWWEIRPSADLTLPEDELITGDFIMLAAQEGTHEQIQLRAQLYPAVDGTVPRLEQMQITFIDSTAGPTAEELAAQAEALAQPATSESGYPKPPVIPRSVWCTDPRCNYSDGLEYHSVTHLILHHTVTSSGADSAAIVRAIWLYHYNRSGFGHDIGYNYLVDKDGLIFEGHLGGDDVVGTHSGAANTGSMALSMIGDYTSITPPEAMRNAAANLFAWKADQKGIDVFDASRLPNMSWGLPHVSGHRDVYGTTACPGDSGHPWVPWLRDEVARRIGFTPEHIYFDEEDPATHFTRSPINWNSTASIGYCGYNRNAWYTWSVTDPAASTNWAEWRPKIPVAGRYELSVYAPYCYTRRDDTDGARYEINHAGGRSTVTVAQGNRLSLWTSLGEYPLSAGTGNMLRLTDLTTTDSGKGVWFDAIRVRYIKPSIALQEPADGTTTNQARIRFSWTVSAPESLSSQRLQVATDSAFQNLVLDEPLSLGERSTEPTFSQRGWLYWRVSLVNTRGENMATPVRRFMVDTTPPTSSVTNVYLFPNGNYSVFWQGQDDASGVARYNIDYRLSGTTTWNHWLTSTTNHGGYFIPPQPGAVYWFRSQAIDAAGNVEPWGPGNGDTSTAEAIILTNHNFLPLFPR